MKHAPPPAAAAASRPAEEVLRSLGTSAEEASRRWKVAELCRQAGFAPKLVQDAHLVQTVLGLVASGVGVALVPASHRNPQTTGVVYRPVQGSTPTVELGVV